jgi:hypothetical protein
VSFRDWSEEEYEEFHDATFETIFNNISGIGDLDQNQLMEAEALFEAGWLTWDTYDMNEIFAIRDEFYDLVGMYEEDFEWEDYRELYDAV